jgi:hypothetical protein
MYHSEPSPVNVRYASHGEGRLVYSAEKRRAFPMWGQARAWTLARIWRR